MNELYFKLDSIILNMIQFNKERQSQLKNHGISLTDYAREYQTVVYNPGRQCGKTTFIARNIGANDVAYCYNIATTNELSNKSRLFNPHQDFDIFTINGTKPVDHDIDIIWINDASVIDKNDIDNLYEIYAGKCNQFIFLG